MKWLAAAAVVLGLPLLAAESTQAKAAADAAVRTRHPNPKPASKRSMKDEHASPSFDFSANAMGPRPPVVWQEDWARSLRVEWEDMTARNSAVEDPVDPVAQLGEDMTKLKRDVAELKRMVRELVEQRNFAAANPDAARALGQ
jgi:hypothetical protein